MAGRQRDDEGVVVVGFALLALLGLGAGLAYALHLRGKPGFGTLIVTVKNAVTDNPLVGAEVMVENTDTETATTDSDGIATLSLSPGSYILTVSYAGFISQSDTITIEELKTTAMLYKLVVGNGPLPGQGTLDGWVTDAQGNPIMAADVAVDGISLRTDIDGYFKQSFLDVGMYNVSASAEGYLPQQVDAEVIADEITTVYFTLTSEDEPPDCPDGMVWNPGTEECECPEGTEWVEPKQECLEPCTGGLTRDPETGECECPEGERWDIFLQKCVPDIPQVTFLPTNRFKMDPLTGFWTLKLKLKNAAERIWSFLEQLPCHDWFCWGYKIGGNPSRSYRLVKLLVADLWGNPLTNYGDLAVHAMEDTNMWNLAFSTENGTAWYATKNHPFRLPDTDGSGIVEVSIVSPKNSDREISVGIFHRPTKTLLATILVNVKRAWKNQSFPCITSVASRTLENWECDRDRWMWIQVDEGW